jgi:phage tail-like protein
MEPKVIKVGGNNYGSVQRVGPVSFATVVLKRGVTKNQDLWKWFDLLAQGKSAVRMNVKITMLDRARSPLHVFKLQRALPTKFKAADLNAQAAAVAVEELHLAHEGLVLERPSGAGGAG